MRVALAHDWLTGMRGGERVLQQLALLHPDADLYTLFHVKGSTSPEIDRLRIHASPLSRLPGVRRYYRSLLPLYPWAAKRFDLSDYDLVISTSHAVAKSVTTSAGTPHLSYCFTPMRYVWDQIDAYLGTGVRRRLATPLVESLRDFDRRTSGPDAVTRFVAISSGVQERIRRAYGRSSTRIFPPVDTDFFVPSGEAPSDYYLLVTPFVPYKRDDIAIEAFRGFGRPLVVVGDGPGRTRLEARAAENIRFLGRVSDRELRDLYAGCRALIHPQDEDFGISAVETQATGRPVIALARGGALDTLRPHPDSLLSSDANPAAPAPGSPTSALPASSATGMLFEEETVEGLRAAVQRFEKVEADFEAAQIRSWALGFGVERFREEIRREIELTLAAHHTHRAHQ